jgi:hypothetical protein
LREAFGVVVIGEEVAGVTATEDQRDPYGRARGATKDLFGELGEARFIMQVTDGAIMLCFRCAQT